MTVAHAAPAQPQWKLMMNTRSSTMLSTEDSNRKYSGRLLSPSARMMDEARLYRIMAGMPNSTAAK